MSDGVSLLLRGAAKGLPKLVLIVFAVVCAALLWRAIAVAGLRVPLDPNEGWNAYHAVAAMNGQTLYPKGYMVNNYPPLSFYAVGALGRFIGDNVVAGRIVSLASFLVVIVGLWRAARMMGCRAGDAGFAVLLFAAWLLLSSDYVGMDDPQMLGHALGMGALLLVLRGRADIAAAALFVVALFVKHNLVAMPLAAALWLLLEDRRRAVHFIVAGGVFSLAGFALFRLVYGVSLLAVLASSRTYAFTQIANSVESWLVWGTVPLVFAVALAIFHRGDAHVRLCAIYIVTALAVGVAFSGGAGVDANVFFDADIALSLAVGLALNRFDMPLARAGMTAVLTLPLLVALFRPPDSDWSDWSYWRHPMADEAAQAKSDIAFLSNHKGPALCEMLSLCYWAGKLAEVDVFNVGQQFATGARSDEDLARRIAAREFSAMEFDSLDPFSLSPRVHTALLSAYRIDHVDDDGIFLVPR